MAIVAPDTLSLYCDASGNETDTVFVVSGALSSVENWLKFDEKWKAALAENGLKYFRMSEFAHSTVEFKTGWKKNEDRRRRLLERLAKIATEHIWYWMGVSVYRSEYDKANKIYQLEEYFQPYALCGLTCVEFAHKWREANHLDYLPIRCTFEEGDDHWGQLSDRVKEEFGQRPIPEPKTSERARPIQVADFAAYEVRKAFVGLDEESDKLFQSFRKSFLAIGEMPHTWGDLKDESIRTELNLRGIPKR